MVKKTGVPHQLVILQDLYRIIASEWVTVNTYIERDLNTIEWRLETDQNVGLEDFEFFLGKLFILRRRIGKYRILVDEQLELFRNQTAESWRHSNAASGLSHIIQNDLKQVEQLIARNSSRISESVELITSVMSVREGETSIKQNQTLGVLTFVATVVLPFNLVAAILGMQTEYGFSRPQSGGSEPNQKKTWVFWVASIGTFFCIWGSFGLYKLAIYIRTYIGSRGME